MLLNSALNLADIRFHLFLPGLPEILGRQRKKDLKLPTSKPMKRAVFFLSLRILFSQAQNRRTVVEGSDLERFAPAQKSPVFFNSFHYHLKPYIESIT